MSPSSTPTFATLRALHALIGDALDDIHRLFSDSHSSPSTSPRSSPSLYPSSTPSSLPSSPSSVTFTAPPSQSPTPPFPASSPTQQRTPSPSLPPLDYPSPSTPYDPTHPSEIRAAHPQVLTAANTLIAACTQLATLVQQPFLVICDAAIGYNLPACLRFLEATHVVEILRDAGDHGLHIRDIAAQNGVNEVILAHVLRLLATHHILLERSPDVFANTRISSLIDTGKSVHELCMRVPVVGGMLDETRATFLSPTPEKKYDDTNGIAAFVGLCTDELFKAAAYLTEAFTVVPPTAPTRTRTQNRDETPLQSQTHLTTLDTADDKDKRVGLDACPCADPCPCVCERGVVKGRVEGESGDRDALVKFTLQPAFDLSTFHKKNPAKAQAQTHAHTPAESKMAVSLPTATAFNIAFSTSAGFFEWLEEGRDERGTDADFGNDGSSGKTRKPNTHRLARFSKAMKGTGAWEAPGAILHGFEWTSLPRGSKIVDVGGGIGSTTMVLARAFSGNVDVGKGIDNVTEGNKDEGWMKNEEETKDDLELAFVVQDRKVVVGLGIAAWKAQCPEMLDSGRVVFQEHDFFAPQPIKDADVFLLRAVLHDWPDNYAKRILRRLREAAVVGVGYRERSLGGEEGVPLVAEELGTRLIIADHVLPLACIDDLECRSDPKGDAGVEMEKTSERSGEQEGKGSERRGKVWDLPSILANVEGAECTLAPAPLLPNLGKASANAYWMDLTMQAIFNGKERTLREMCALALSAGWRVVRVTRAEGSLFGHIVCVPIDMPPDEDDYAIENDSLSPATSSNALHDSLSTEEGLQVRGREPHAVSPQSLSRLQADMGMERPSLGSRCGTPTFGSRMNLPKADEHMPMTLRRGKKTINRIGSLNLGLKTRVVPMRRDAQASSRVDFSRQAQLVGLGLRQTRSMMTPHSPLAPSSIPRLVSGPPSPSASTFSVRQSHGQGPPPVPTSPLVNTFSQQSPPALAPSASRRRLTVTASEPRRVGSGYSSDTVGTWAGTGATSAGSDHDHVGAVGGGNVRTRGLMRRPSLAVLPSPRTPGKTDGNTGTGREKLTRRPSLAVLMSPKTPGKGDGNTGTGREITRRPSLAMLSSPRTPGRGGNGSDGIYSGSLRELSRRPSLGVLLSPRVPGRSVGDDGGSGAGAMGNAWR